MALVKAGQPRPDHPDRRQEARDPDSLVRQLADADPGVRRWAARDLADHPDRAAALGDRLDREADASVREALLTGLMTIGTDEAARPLIRLLRSEDASLRNGAIEALQQMPDATTAHLGALLADGDSDVRIFAINILQSLRHPQAAQWLHAVIRDEDHINVLASAVDVLAEIGTPAMVADLAVLKGRFPDEPFLHFAVDLAIRRIGAE